MMKRLMYLLVAMLLKLTAVIITVDIMKKDSEIKLLLGCSKEEKTALDFCNQTDNMQGILVSRKYK